MKVSKTGGAKDVGATRKKGAASTSGDGFSLSLKSVQGETSAAPAFESGLVGNVDALFSVQEVPSINIAYSILIFLIFVFIRLPYWLLIMRAI